MECIKCGKTGSQIFLLDAISSEGIVQICRKCNIEEKLPLVKKPLETQPSLIKQKEPEQKLSVYQRMRKLSGFKPVEDEVQKIQKQAIQNEEVQLRELVDKNYKTKLPSERNFPEELVENFHWKIMRARRLKKLTQKEFAEKIQESEESIKFAEQGYVNKNDLKFLYKLEDALGIQIVKNRKSLGDSIKENLPEAKELFEKVLEADEIDFDPVFTKNITISDLQQIKKEKQNQVPESVKKKDEFLDKQDLTEEEMNDIIFGRR